MSFRGLLFDPDEVDEIIRMYNNLEIPVPEKNLKTGVSQTTYRRGWNRLRNQVFKRDGHKCQVCGTTDNLECDHIIPRSRGGADEMSNLWTLCKSCNCRKGTKTRDEWLESVREP